jgi:adenine-specific DNA-methyltransferase
LEGLISKKLATERMMSIAFTYMGTKRRIANHVAEIIDGARRGPLLDLFAGMSSVGLAVMPRRNLWCNDVQHFAHTVAKATFTSRTAPLLTAAKTLAILDFAARNQSKLKLQFSDELSAEDDLLNSSNLRKVKNFNSELVRKCCSRTARAARTESRRKPDRTPYSLFTVTYSGGYIGLRQAIDIDSFRFAIDELKRSGQIDAEQHRWMLLALCKALAKVANTTGHFAQYLDVKEETLTRFLAKRRRAIFREWVAGMTELTPAGTSAWRHENRAFRQDAKALLRKLHSGDQLPSVVYADPPYTADHYSRYYHLWETLLRYDYPEPSGHGLYRADRFISHFSIKTKVEQEFRSLITAASSLGVELVLNYPENGLLANPRRTLIKLLRQSFKHAEIAAAIAHQHSTLGASKGVEKEDVTELIFYAH